MTINSEYYETLVQDEIIGKTKRQKEEKLKNSKGRRGRKKTKNMYFTLETENAIIAFNKETDPTVKGKIYNEYIKYPMEKLVESIFNRFGFSYFDSRPADVMSETLSNIMLNLHKFQEGKGKAFSYFSIVCKNYLIQVNNKNHEKWRDRETLMSSMPESWEVEDDFKIKQRQDDSSEFVRLMIEFWENNLNSIFNKKRDIKIADAIVELFRKNDSLELFNKKALYCYIREMTGCKTTHITKVIKAMKEIVNDMLQEYLEFGNINSVNKKYNDVFWKGKT